MIIAGYTATMYIWVAPLHSSNMNLSFSFMKIIEESNLKKDNLVYM